MAIAQRSSVHIVILLQVTQRLGVLILLLEHRLTQRFDARIAAMSLCRPALLRLFELCISLSPSASAFIVLLLYIASRVPSR